MTDTPPSTVDGRPPRLLAIASGKGGTGKSTLALALGHTLAAAGRPVVLVDLDPQASLTDYAGAEPTPDPLHAAPVTVHGCTLYPSGRPLHHATEAQVAAHLDRAMTTHPGAIVLADLAPNWSDVAHRAVLARPDVRLVLAVRLDAGGIKAAGELAGEAERRGVPYVVVPTFGKRWVVASTTLANLRAFYGDAVTRAVIPEDVRAAEAVPPAEPVTRYAPRSRAAEAMRALAVELVPSSHHEVAQP